MLNFRVIPVLLYNGKGLYKSIKFDKYKYIGDPINAVKIFNDKEVDELIFLDINSANRSSDPDYAMIKEIASECFMPVCYGGRISNLDQVKRILALGIEKISINRMAVKNPNFVDQLTKEFGASTIVISIDVKKNFWGKYEIFIDNGKVNTKIDPLDFVKSMDDIGVGEILINSIDRDGMMNGYDIDLISKITSIVKIPVIACGGARNLKDFTAAINEGKAAAVAAGSLFVYHGKHNAVLINYPSQTELKALFL